MTAEQAGGQSTSSGAADRQKAIRALGDMIRDIKFAMLTTVARDGRLRSRPMATVETTFDGDLWFFTDLNSPKVEEIDAHPQVNVSYAAPDRQSYVSVSGTATHIADRQKLEIFWNPIYKVWFPQGLDDPHLGLLKIAVEEAEYWDTHSSTMVQLAGFMKAVVTGRRANPGEHEKIGWQERQVTEGA